MKRPFFGAWASGTTAQSWPKGIDYGHDWNRPREGPENLAKIETRAMRFLATPKAKPVHSLASASRPATSLRVIFNTTAAHAPARKEASSERCATRHHRHRAGAEDPQTPVRNSDPMAVQPRRDLASRHGSIVRIAAAHSWSYRSDTPICTRTPLDPVPDCRVVHLQAAFAEQLFGIAERERVPQVPAHGAKNQLGLGLSPLEDRRSDCLFHDLFRLPAAVGQSCNTTTVVSASCHR